MEDIRHKHLTVYYRKFKNVLGDSIPIKDLTWIPKEACGSAFVDQRRKGSSGESPCSKLFAANDSRSMFDKCLLPYVFCGHVDGYPRGFVVNHQIGPQFS